MEGYKTVFFIEWNRKVKDQSQQSPHPLSSSLQFQEEIESHLQIMTNKLNINSNPKLSRWRYELTIMTFRKS